MRNALIYSLSAVAVGVFGQPARLGGQIVPAVSQETTTVRAYDGRTLPAVVLRVKVPAVSGLS